MFCVFFFIFISVSLSSFVPRQNFLSIDLPVVIETFCKYPLKYVWGFFCLLLRQEGNCLEFGDPAKFQLDIIFR